MSTFPKHAGIFAALCPSVSFGARHAVRVLVGCLGPSLEFGLAWKEWQSRQGRTAFEPKQRSDGWITLLAGMLM